MQITPVTSCLKFSILFLLWIFKMRDPDSSAINFILLVRLYWLLRLDEAFFLPFALEPADHSWKNTDRETTPQKSHFGCEAAPSVTLVCIPGAGCYCHCSAHPLLGGVLTSSGRKAAFIKVQCNLASSENQGVRSHWNFKCDIRFHMLSPALAAEGSELQKYAEQHSSVLCWVKMWLAKDM